MLTTREIFAHIKKWVRTNLLRPSAPFNPPTTPSSQLSGVPPCPASLVAANEGGWLKKKDMVSLLRVPRVEIKLMEIQMPRWMSMPTLRLPSQNRMSSCTIVYPGGELDFWKRGSRGHHLRVVLFHLLT